MNEASFWTDRVRPGLIAGCRAAGLRHHFERVENAVAVGTPDVDWCVAGVAGKIELKYSPRHPARPATPVLGRAGGLRRSQVVWISRRGWAGGRCFVMIGTPERTWLLNVGGWPAARLAGIGLLSSAALDEIGAWGGVHLSDPTVPLALIGERPVDP